MNECISDAKEQIVSRAQVLSQQLQSQDKTVDNKNAEWAKQIDYSDISDHRDRIDVSNKNKDYKDYNEYNEYNDKYNVYNDKYNVCNDKYENFEAESEFNKIIQEQDEGLDDLLSTLQTLHAVSLEMNVEIVDQNKKLNQVAKDVDKQNQYVLYNNQQVRKLF